MKRMIIAAAGIAALAACGGQDQTADTLGGTLTPMDTATAPAAAPAPMDTMMMDTLSDTGMTMDTGAARDTGVTADTGATSPTP